MKTNIFSLLLFLLFITNVSFAAADESFSYDKKAIENEFSDLNQLEQIVNSNENLTYNELKSAGILPAELNDLQISLSHSPLEPPLGIPGFWWGCVLGPIGILIAYLLSDNDKSQAKSALTGCIVGYGSVIVIYVVFYVIILSAYGITY